MLAAKANFEAELILLNNISRVYKYINSITRQDAIPQNVNLDSQMATSGTEKANLFNHTFFWLLFAQRVEVTSDYTYLQVRKLIFSEKQLL